MLECQQQEQGKLHAQLRSVWNKFYDDQTWSRTQKKGTVVIKYCDAQLISIVYAPNSRPGFKFKNVIDILLTVTRTKSYVI